MVDTGVQYCTVRSSTFQILFLLRYCASREIYHDWASRNGPTLVTRAVAMDIRLSLKLGSEPKAASAYAVTTAVVLVVQVSSAFRICQGSNRITNKCNKTQKAETKKAPMPGFFLSMVLIAGTENVNGLYWYVF